MSWQNQPHAEFLGGNEEANHSNATPEQPSGDEWQPIGKGYTYNLDALMILWLKGRFMVG